MRHHKCAKAYPLYRLLNKNSHWFSILFLMVFFLIQCKKNPDLNNPPSPAAGEGHLTIDIVSGNNQIGTGDQQLNEPVTFRVLDEQERPVRGVSVDLRVIEGDGETRPSFSVVTDADGSGSFTWEIDNSYNAVEISISLAGYDAVPVYAYATGDNPTGLSEARTINSLEPLGGALYRMQYFGDYSSLMEQINNRMFGPWTNTQLKKGGKEFCSLFSTFGDPDNILFGRNFDNPTGWRCLTVVAYFNPPDGYASIAPVRMRDFGYELGTDFTQLTYDERRRLIEAAYYTPDGINEQGVVAGLANVVPQTYNRDPNKQVIFCTHLIRKILDQASNVNEAVQVAMNYNIAGGNQTLDIHVLIADAEGKSVILEPADGEMKVIPIEGEWQVLTNMPVYQRSPEEMFTVCNRYQSIYQNLENAQGVINKARAMGMLSEVAWPSTEWSAVYCISDRKIRLCLDYNYSDVWDFDFGGD